MRFLSLVLLCAAGTDLSGAKLQNHTRRGNKVALQLSEGSGEFEWVSPSTFRIRRSLRSEPLSSTPLSTDAITFTAANSPAALKLDSEFLRVEIDKNTLQLKIRTSSGLMLLSESAPLSRNGGDLTIEWDRAANEKIYGGPATGVKPFFISSRGYGLQMSTMSVIRFDLALPNRIAASSAIAESLEYFFHYGPSIWTSIGKHHER